jgi:hypothetical protein
MKETFPEYFIEIRPWEGTFSSLPEHGYFGVAET